MFVTVQRLLLLAVIALLLSCGVEQQVLGEWQHCGLLPGTNRSERECMSFEFLRNGQVLYRGPHLLASPGAWTTAEDGDVVMTFPIMRVLRARLEGNELIVRFNREDLTFHRDGQRPGSGGPPSPSGTSESAAGWNALDRNDANAVRAFLAGDPGSYRSQADAVLADLERSGYEAAVDADTIEAFQAFLNDFPETAHGTAARGRIAELRALGHQNTATGVVRVVVVMESPEGRILYGSGSGFVVASNLVVTNAHVVAPARQRPEYGVAIVPPPGNGLLAARIVRYSPTSELALLEFDGGTDLTVLTISTVEPHAGDVVVALGYPDVDYQGAAGADLLRLSQALRTSGQISSLRDRAPTGDAITTIYHQAVISSGSSGGPLLDQCGRVIGVNTWHVSNPDTQVTRGVSTRTASLLQFLSEARIGARLSRGPCA